MAALKEITLNDVRINTLYLEDSLSAILHTILFVRAPSAVKSKDRTCTSLSPLIYATCGPKEVDKIIETSIEAFKKSLFVSNGCMKGEVVLSFFDKREVKEYLGLFTRNETVCFESWRISIVLLDAGGNDGIAALATGNVQQDKAAAYRSAYEQITNTMMSILEATNTATDHIPSSMYDYEIFVTQPTPCTGMDPNNNKQVQKDTTVNNYHADAHRRSQSVDAVQYRS
eukprot:gene9756-11464_t